jgi:CTP:phosphocholine cytidylyltransferase-like protein/thiamine kinase-like enzyme
LNTNQESGKFKVKNAIILAAGFGSRFVPLTYETPKGLLKVFGIPMIERQIGQLLEKGVEDIIIVVGDKKEEFDYLAGKYGVKLVYNPEYASKNNLASLYCVRDSIDSSYILASDHWIERNIFNEYEPQSWYSCLYFDGPTDEWCVAASSTDKIESVAIGGEHAWALVGPAYFSPSFSALFREYLSEYYENPVTGEHYWEQILIDRIESLPIYINRQSGNVTEFENLEELRAFDPSYEKTSNSRIMETIAKVFDVPEKEIWDIQPLNLGMTNRSFTFVYNWTRYIMRVPGEGANDLVDRQNEYSVYKVISPLKICDDVVYIDADSGYKISAFLEEARVCDPLNTSDVSACMKKLREFHNMDLKVDHAFDVFERIDYYRRLWHDQNSVFPDYQTTEANIKRLREYIDSAPKKLSLSHIDSVSDNFLFVWRNGKEEIRMIDWEYAGMADPHMDIAMFAIYALYDREQTDALIDCYFTEGCPDDIRLKIYAYVAVCGFLWSNWCEYKRHLGVEFGDYAIRQYLYAKEFYQIFTESISERTNQK